MWKSWLNLGSWDWKSIQDLVFCISFTGSLVLVAKVTINVNIPTLEFSLCRWVVYFEIHSIIMIKLSVIEWTWGLRLTNGRAISESSVAHRYPWHQWEQQPPGTDCNQMRYTSIDTHMNTNNMVWRSRNLRPSTNLFESLAQTSQLKLKTFKPYKIPVVTPKCRELPWSTTDQYWLDCYLVWTQVCPHQNKNL